MIRLAIKNDLPYIEALVETAKEIMKEFNNNQWDDKYPAREHFEEDIANQTLYVLEDNDEIKALLLSTNNNQNGMINLTGQLNGKAHMLFIA